jgi:hypothetical protein
MLKTRDNYFNEFNFSVKEASEWESKRFGIDYAQPLTDSGSEA